MTKGRLLKRYPPEYIRFLIDEGELLPEEVEELFCKNIVQ